MHRSTPIAMKTAAVIAPEMLPVPPVKGGAVEYWIHEVTQRLERRGLLKSIVVSRPAGDAGTRIASAPAAVEIAWTAAERLLTALKDRSSRKNPLRHLAKAALVLSYAMGVRRQLAGLRTDVLYVHNDPLIAWLVAMGRPEPLVLHMHNDHLSLAALKPLYRRALNRSSLVLCVSDYISARVCASFPEHRHKVFTVANATDPDFFGSPTLPAHGGDTQATNFLYVGRLTHDKGVHVLIEAFSAIARRFPHARLTIAGSSFFADAPRTAYEAGLAASAGAVAGAIEFTGFVPHAQLRHLYAQADVVVVPSIWHDPAPLVVLEAMSSRTCVIASRMGGIPELVADGETGLLVPPGDPQALSAAMARLIGDHALRVRLSKAARRAVLERFSYERLAGDVADQIGRACATP